MFLLLTLLVVVAPLVTLGLALIAESRHEEFSVWQFGMMSILWLMLFVLIIICEKI